MGYGIKKSLDVQQRAQGGLRDLYSSAVHFGLSHDEILTRRAEIFERCGVRRAPHWVNAYLEGYWAHIMEMAYRDDLVFGGMVSDKFYSTHSDREDYYEKNGISPQDYSDDGRVQMRGHYWRANLKPFFISRLNQT